MQPKFGQNAIKMQLKCSQNAFKMQPVSSQKQLKCSQNSVKIQQKCSHNAANIQSKCSQISVRIQPKCNQNSVKMQPKSVKIKSVLEMLINWKVFSLILQQILFCFLSEKCNNFINMWCSMKPIDFSMRLNISLMDEQLLGTKEF